MLLSFGALHVRLDGRASASHEVVLHSTSSDGASFRVACCALTLPLLNPLPREEKGFIKIKFRLLPPPTGGAERDSMNMNTGACGICTFTSI